MENVCVMIVFKEKIVHHSFAIAMEKENVYIIKNVYAMMDFSAIIVKK